MEYSEKNIEEWGREISGLSLSSWEQLPGIPLYMDQVMAVLKGELQAFKRGEEDKLLTNTMVNNYVKNGVISHPIHKKYSKDQLAAISMVAMLKSLLSIQDLAVLLGDCQNFEELYTSFLQAQEESLHQAGERLVDGVQQGEDLKLLALKLSAEAMARQAAAQRILWELEQNDRAKKGKKQKP